MESFVKRIICLSIALKNGQKFADIVQKCKTGENATEEDFANLKKNVKPKTKAMKCLGACISENSGVVSFQLNNLFCVTITRFPLKLFSRSHRNHGSDLTKLFL